MEERLVFFAAVLALGIAAQWLAWRFRLPSILLLLGFGFTAGLFYDQSRIVDENTLFAIVSLSVAVIMLEGGLSLRFGELREAGLPVARLIGLGSLVTWGLSTLAARFLAGLGWPLSTLIGAVLVVTGPTVIGPLLRSVKPRKPVGAILKWEGIVIDPFGALLALLVFNAVFELHGSESVAASIGKTLVIGGAIGYGAGRLLIFVLRHHWAPDYLHSVVILVVGLALFAVSNAIQHESGLLTVTVIGLVLANQDRAPVRHIIEFKENLRILLISSLFIVLGGRISLDDILSIWREALLFLLALIVVVRPASVFLSLAGSRLKSREKLYLALMAPRGIVAAAVSAIFAMKLAALGGDAEAAKLAPLTYSVIVGTVAFYGLLAAPLARRLGLAVKNPQGILFAGIRPWVVEAAAAVQREGFRVLLLDSNYHATRKARMAGLPAVTANVLSDFVTEDLDLAGIGRLLAVTSNDHVNAMACIGFGHSLGRSNVYQLRPEGDADKHRSSVSPELTGRILFGEPVTSASLDRLEREGALVKRTCLTGEYSHEDFREYYGPEAVVLFVLRANGHLSIPTGDPVNCREGDCLIALVKEPNLDPARKDNVDV